MTGRLFMLWLRIGAQAVMVATGGLFVLIGLVLVILTFGHPATPAPARDLATIGLAHVWMWSAGGFMLATAAWVFLDSVIAAFWTRGGA